MVIPIILPNNLIKNHSNSHHELKNNTNNEINSNNIKKNKKNKVNKCNKVNKVNKVTAELIKY